MFLCPRGLTTVSSALLKTSCLCKQYLCPVQKSVLFCFEIEKNNSGPLIFYINTSCIPFSYVVVLYLLARWYVEWSGAIVHVESHLCFSCCVSPVKEKLHYEVCAVQLLHSLKLYNIALKCLQS